MKVPGDEFHRTFRQGGVAVPKFELEAGVPMEIELEFDWTNDLLSSDWSVVLAAPSGVISVRHENNIATMHMPVIGAKPLD